MQNFFFIRFNGRYVRLLFSEINYVEASKNYIKIVTDKKVWLVLISLKRIEQILPSGLFRRIHKSFIVSLEKMDEFDSEWVFIKGIQLPIGVQYKGILEKCVLIANAEFNEIRMPLNFYGVQAMPS
jgi:two-component system, LytTR family, response regulator